MRAPDRSWHGVDYLNWLMMMINQRMGSYLAVHNSRMLLLVLVPMLVAWMTVSARVEASEDSSKVAQLAEINASGNRAGEYHLAPGDRLAIMVFDQEQLSGDFIVDGTGGILLPLAGRVSVAGLTLAEAQQLIQERFANGVLVQPAVSVRIPEYRPIFVTGDVRRAGSYPFLFGGSVKAAIATAGGEGPATEQLLSVAMSEFIMAEERVRQLETNRIGFRIRQARLEAQRDGWGNFVMPQLVGFNPGPIDFNLIYVAENETFLRLVETYHDQLEKLQQQRPRIEAEIKAVTDQIAKEEERLDIVNERLADLEHLFGKGLLRKDVLISQRIEKALVQAELSRLAAQVARSRQTMGDLDVKIEEVKANYKRQILGELQETSERLREIEATLGTARKLRDVRAEYANIYSSEPDYTILLSRRRGSSTISLNATYETTLEPGDVIEVKLKRREPGDLWSPPTEAARSLIPSSSLAEGTTPSSR